MVVLLDSDCKGNKISYKFVLQYKNMVVRLKYDNFPNLILVMPCYFTLQNKQTLRTIPQLNPLSI